MAAVALRRGSAPLSPLPPRRQAPRPARRDPVETMHELASVLALSLLPLPQRAEQPSPGPVLAPELTGGAASAAFIANAGQWDERAYFRAGNGPLAAWILADGFVVELRDERTRRASALRFCCSGAGGEGPRGERALAQRRTYLGAEPARRRAGVPAYERLRFASIRPGVDLVLRAGMGLFEYDLELAPGVRLEGLAIEVEGADALELAPDGALLVHCGAGTLRHSPPLAFELDAAGARTSVDCAFRLLGERSFGFVAPGRALTRALVVDPGVEWGTYLGDYEHDVALALALAPSGEVVVAGTTSSPSFPVTAGSYDLALDGASDAFVARIAADGATLLAATYLGGSGSEYAFGVALTPAGEIVLAGETSSADFPTTTGAFDRTLEGSSDAFVAVLDPSGSALLRSTLVGGSGAERANALALDAQSRVLIAGSTTSPNFPVTPGAFDTSYGGGTFGGGDAFVTRLAPQLTSLDASSFLGAGGNESALALALAPDGGPIVGGLTSSSAFPVTPGAFDTTPGGAGSFQDGFVTRFTPSLAALAYSTFFGGSANDALRALAVRADGALAVAGGTESSDFPTTPGAHQSLAAGGEDAFVALLAPDGASLYASTLLGGAGSERANAVGWRAGGALLAAGRTSSSDFPSTPFGWRPHIHNPDDPLASDAFVVEIALDGALLYGSFVGGRWEEEALALTPTPDGRVLLCGHTSSIDFPTPGGFDNGYDFSLVPDGFALRFEFSRFPFDYCPQPPHSQGFESIAGASFASHASGQHQIYVDLAIGGSRAWLFHGPAAAAIPFHGSLLCVAPPFVRHATMNLDFLGAATIQVPIPAALVGTTRHWQFWFQDPGSASGFALSPAIEVTYYP